MHQPAVPDSKLALFGVSAADFDTTVEVFPDIWPAFRLFDAMDTQWRVGLGGRTGLDYAAIPSVMGLIGIPKKMRNSVFQDLRVMESEALIAMSTE